MNKAPHLLLIALLLLVVVPPAAAQTPGLTLDRHTLTIVETQGCPTYATCPPDAPTDYLLIFDRLDLTIHQASAWAANRTWTFWAASPHMEPLVLVSRNEFQRDVNPALVNQTGTPDGPYRRFTVDLASVYPTMNNGDKLSIQLVYSVAGATHRQRTSHDVPLSVVFASPRPDRIATANNLDGLRLASDRYHAITQGVPAGTEFTITFSNAPPPPGSLRNFNTQLWALGGLVLGFLVASYAAGRGWIGQQRAKKYEKAGELESRDLLEARRRSLMAALKELEVAHDAKEIPDGAYAPLKEEYKAQAVRVMRRLEEKKEGG